MAGPRGMAFLSISMTLPGYRSYRAECGGRGQGRPVSDPPGSLFEGGRHGSALQRSSGMACAVGVVDADRRLDAGPELARSTGGLGVLDRRRPPRRGTRLRRLA